MLSEILLKVLVMDAPDRQPYRPRPSNAGPENCLRSLTYQRIRQVPGKDMGGRFLQVLEDSSWGEELLAELISKSAFVLHSRQMHVIGYEEPGWQISGSIDGIVTDPLNVDRLLEIKNLNHFSFERLWDGYTLPENYLVQCAFYLRGVQAVNPEITEAILLVKSKNTAGMIDFLLRYDRAGDALTVVQRTRHTGEIVPLNIVRQGIVSQAIERFKRVEQHAKDGTLPDRLSPGSWQCGYCPFEEDCWKNFIDETTAHDTVDLSQTADGPGLVSAAHRYLLTNTDLKALEITKDTVRDQILTTIRGHNAKKATVEGFSLSRSVQTREGRIRWDEVPGSVKAALEPFRNADSVIEVLRVTAKKKGDKGA